MKIISRFLSKMKKLFLLMAANIMYKKNIKRAFDNQIPNAAYFLTTFRMCR